MRVLLVEDDADFADETSGVLAALPTSPDLRIAASRDAALLFLREEFFDLLLLDLRIPTADLALDADPVHGLSVFTAARRLAPGMPVLVLTSSSAEEFIPTLLEGTQTLDIWGSGTRIGTVQFLKKIKLTDLPGVLSAFALPIIALAEVEVQSPKYELALEQSRLVRIFACKFGAARCVISPLGGGLSGAQVLSIKLVHPGGGVVHHAVAKLGPLRDIRDEARRFETYVSRLEGGATPRMLALVEHGAKDRGGVFYQLAREFDGTAFDAAGWRDDASAGLASSLERMTQPWSNNFPEMPKTVAEIRSRVLSDEDLREIVAAHDLGWVEAFERGRVQSLWCCVHGDLHGENALVARDGSAVLIDYGDVEDGPRSLDPISLEFSLLFHPQGPLLNGAWPSAEQARNWSDLESYLIDCPLPEFVRAVREWAIRAAVGQRELAATAYAYVVRQLKYKTTDGVRALQLLEGARSLWSKT